MVPYLVRGTVFKYQYLKPKRYNSIIPLCLKHLLRFFADVKVSLEQNPYTSTLLYLVRGTRTSCKEYKVKDAFRDVYCFVVRLLSSRQYRYDYLKLARTNLAHFRRKCMWENAVEVRKIVPLYQGNNKNNQDWPAGPSMVHQIQRNKT